ncbi:MAG: DUF4274 domain-containing protein [Ruminococcus sp.]|nr:DUF4274 domain-containing protein [Ruminococcus sp.]MBR6386052.1 DUF4274 domain-containing protein [Ruminococcus sp.]
MDYSMLRQILMTYNWNGGFEIPKRILCEPACDLALAMEIFYLCDGYGYFLNSNSGSKEWLDFISRLYGDIIVGKYHESENHYEIPLTESQKLKMKENKIPKIFLEDI